MHANINVGTEIVTSLNQVLKELSSIQHAASPWRRSNYKMKIYRCMLNFDIKYIYQIY